MFVDPKPTKPYLVKFIGKAGTYFAVTPTITPTVTSTPLTSLSPTPTNTQTTTPTKTPTPTPTITPTVTSTPIASLSPTPTNTQTTTPTNTQTTTPTNTQTTTPTITPTPSTTPPPPFISIWTAELSLSNTIELPHRAGGTYSGTINWGDGNTSANTYANRSHTYASSGDYIITISGVFEGWLIQTYYRNSIKEILQWGPMRDDNTPYSPMFADCQNLVLTGVTDTPNLVGVTTLYGMFFGCTSITTVNNMNSWDTSSVTDMDNMFWGATLFNQDISNWNVSNVTEMRGMFLNASSFNQDLSSWCVSLISPKPPFFDTNASSWTGGAATRPQWGTCPP